MTKFSVPSTGTSVLKGHAIVTHEGNTLDTGIWSCSKDKESSCPHVKSVYKALSLHLANNEGMSDV